MSLIYFLIISLFSFSTVYLFSIACRKLNILDRPNERSSHIIPTPRLGGLGFITIFSISLGILFSTSLLLKYSLLIVGFFLLVLFSTIDDLKGLSPLTRFIIHILFGFTVYYSGFQFTSIELPFITLTFSGTLALFLTIFYCVSWVNVYNFMDGINGYAGSMGIIGNLSLLILFSIPFSSATGLILFTLIAVLSGFLVLNIYKPKTFMGDGGSAFLGGVVAVTTLYLPTFIAALCFAPFLFDASITLIKRLLRKERFWEAHREHYYQLLLRSQWPPLSILGIELVHMLINLGLLFLYTRYTQTQVYTLALFSLLFLGKFWTIQLLFKKQGN